MTDTKLPEWPESDGYRLDHEGMESWVYWQMMAGYWQRNFKAADARYRLLYAALARVVDYSNDPLVLADVKTALKDCGPLPQEQT